MTNKFAKITAWGHYLPEKIVDNKFIAEKIKSEGGYEINPDTIEFITGVRFRRYAEFFYNASDLAVKAVENLLKNLDKDNSYLTDVDLLIFAAASQDLIEPATSAIIQSKLGIYCPTFDIKNACNSFMNALELADSFITSAVYKKILIVTGEKPSSSLKLDISDKDDYKTHFAALSFGDGGAAVVVEAKGEKSFLKNSKFITRGEFWESGTLPGGGTMNPHNLEATYFKGNAKNMVSGFLEFAPKVFIEFLKKSKKRPNNFDAVCVHQPTKESFDIFVKESKVNENKVLKIFENYGNIAAASIPVAICLAVQEGKIKQGDNLLLVGLGGGITFGLMDLII